MRLQWATQGCIGLHEDDYTEATGVQRVTTSYAGLQHAILGYYTEDIHKVAPDYTGVHEDKPVKWSYTWLQVDLWIHLGNSGSWYTGLQVHINTQSLL